MKNTLENFTNKYSLSKTLKFELIPTPKTLENIEKKGLISTDENRAESYKKVKKIIDEYHKYFISIALENLKLSNLYEFSELYNKNNKTDEDKILLNKIQLELRKEIVNTFSKTSSNDIKEKYDRLFKKELIQVDLIDWINQNGDYEDIKLVEEFKTFTTYFTGFNENRKNMYTAEEHSTGIAYRLIHENLPKFLDNCRSFELLKSKYPTFKVDLIEKELEMVIQGKLLDSIFSIDFFNETLTQKGIDFYNTVLGGLTEKDVKKKIRGINEYINLFRQENHLKSRDVPTLKVLYKQILSDRESVSFLQDEFLDDSDVLNSIEVFYRSELLEKEIDGNKINVFSSISALMKDLNSFDTTKIYLKNDTSLTDISQKIYGSWSIVKVALKFHYETVVKPLNGKKRTEKYDEDLEKWIGTTKNGQFSLQFVQAICDAFFKELEEKEDKNTGDEWNEYFKNMNLIIDENGNSSTSIDRITLKYEEIKDVLNVEIPSSKKLIQEQHKVDKLKAFLDEIVSFLHFIKPLILKDPSLDKEEGFYSMLEGLFTQLDLATPLYNKTRNYLTKKAYSTDKIKLNFENAQLLAGWDVNKESDNTSVLLRKDGLYYLCIMDKKHNKVFKDIPLSPKKETNFEKIVNKFFPDASKMIPKCSTQLKAVKHHFSISKDDYIISGKVFNGDLSISEKVYQLNNYVFDLETNSMVISSGDGEKRPKKFQKKYLELSNDTIDFKDSLTSWVDFCKDFLIKYESTCQFNFTFKSSKEYNSLDEFYRDIDTQTYKITFQNIEEKYINSLIEEGKIFLFQIYNKDFSPNSKGKPNLHTMYWRALFEEENLMNVVYKLNGEAEVFFRKKSLEYSEEIWKRGHHAVELKDKFSYPIIKDKRFALDKFQFHVPITMNFKATDGNYFNTNVNEFLQNNPNVNIIGIDRGERHLLYLTLINQKGESILQKTLNKITNEITTVDYHNLLDTKEKNRDTARKSWGTIETIKELKEGYLSLVIHEVAKMMVENMAIVVLEDLNFGFKRGRQKVEKQVYQKFEKMLIDKLNYLIFKDKKETEVGGLYNALQLTSKFESFQKLGKQCGFLFYVPAALTSKIDPTTGFVNFLDTRYYSIEKSQEFFSKFGNIQYNTSKDYFEFEFDYNNFTLKAEGTKTKWSVCTHGVERWRYNPTSKGSERVNVTAELKTLFEKNTISFKNGNDLKNDIITSENKSLFSSLFHLLGLTLSLRHSESGTENDFILSPVADTKGVFFDSRNSTDKLPKDSDANGAYHIALKGLWILDNINKSTDFKKLRLAISNKEWLQFVQTKPYSKIDC